jgi:hypothetical protein
MADTPSDPPQRTPPKIRANGGHVSHDDLYRAYFHAGSFRVLASTNVSEDGKAIVGKLAQSLPSLTSSSAPMVTAPRLIELCFQTAGVIEIGSTQRLGLPSSIDEVKLHSGADDAGERLAEVFVSREEAGLCFEARVCDGQGRVVAEIHGYRTSALPSTMDQKVLGPLQAGLTGFTV